MGMYGKYVDGVDCQKAKDGMTKQEFRDTTDINKMVAQYELTGLVQNANGGVPMYGDVSEMLDYKEAADKVGRANSMFAALPAELRERFGNDPGRMISFLSEAKNVDEAVRLGIVVLRERPGYKEPVKADGGNGGPKKE